ncbi:MAG: Maf family protein [Humidesulfovibrio sp.]|jgi:septum formation protein|uniref:Maf family protein n=1 Tax=Humidesulfovibrio sp. TaxID=2910988 RepID=UPI002732E3C0|nr:Maf family protein [Humidesulfovibrio sp.]MDP2848729.1 Maf family protein [Humidesulfovibrio sp.]
MTNAFTPPAGPGAYRTLSALVLGSSSPRRRELLGSLGLEFEVCPSNAPEPPPLPGELPEAYARRMALQKTTDVSALYPDSTVLGADTIVVLPGAPGADAVVLGKPVDQADALSMLTRLSGRSHLVITGCCLALPGKADPLCFAVSTEVFMRASTRAELAAYAATGEPSDKAGAYAIQGLGGFLVERVSGSYTNVVGLPVAECAASLLEHGIIGVRPGNSGGWGTP